MPKAKKGGGGKGGGKTEEERLLFLQQRAQAEEEMAKKKEEILTLFLKDKLQKEEKNAAVNLLKLNEGWRSILRQTRAAELRRDLTVLSQTFERQLDGLDSVIKNLERDLRDAERQSAHVRRVHLQHVERLWAQQDKRLMFVQQQWENALQQLSFRFCSDREQMLSHSQQQRSDLTDATFAVEQQHDEVMQKIHEMYRESIASYTSAHDEKKSALVLQDSESLKKMTLKNQESMKICSKDTKKLSFLLYTTRQYDENMEADVKKVKRLQDAVIQLRAKNTSAKKENVLVEKDLTVARNQVNRKTHALRDQLTEAQTAARKQLTELTVQGDNAAKKLKAVIAKGQKVLRVADMCRKLESEQRKVSLLIPSEEQRQDDTEEPGKEMSELHQVTRSINTSVLQREALKRQRDELSRENQQLRLLLRQHLDAMTVSGHDLDGNHALLTVYCAPTTSIRPDTDRRHTVIEAVHAVKHSM